MNFHVICRILLPVIILSLLLTLSGSCWIDRLYSQALQRDILSFPDQIARRARYRKLLLFFFLLLSVSIIWIKQESPLLFYHITAIALLSFVTLTDFEQYVIFDAMLFPFTLTGICYILHLQLPMAEHLAAAIGGGLLFFLLAVITNGAIGGGDIKLVAVMGLWFGYRQLLIIIMYGLLGGGIAALIMLLAKQKRRHSYFAYGPYFALTGIGILLGWFPF